MESIKTHWPKLAIAAAAAVGFTVYIIRNNRVQVSRAIDISAEEGLVDGTSWPHARRIVDA